MSSLPAAQPQPLYDHPALYDQEYARRRQDLAFYCSLASHRAAQRGQAGTSVLVLGCGTGRLVLPLLAESHQVLGVDHSAAMLQRLAQRLAAKATRPAGKSWKAASARLQLVQADFRALPLSSVRYPLIFCPFGAFLHLYTRQDVERFLAHVRRLLLPGGLFALDLFHPDPAWLSRRPDRRYDRRRLRDPQTGQTLVYSTSHLYDPQTQLAWIRLYYDPLDPRAPQAPPPRELHLTHRIFYPAELAALLHYGGFSITSLSGDFSGGRLTPYSRDLVLCCRATADDS